MEKIFTLLIVLLFISSLIYNFKRRRELILVSLISKGECFVLALSLGVFIYLAHRLDRGWAPYLLFLLGWLSLVLPVISYGLSNDGLNYLRSRGIYLKVFPFDDIRVIKLRRDGELLRLESQGNGEIIKNIYKISKEEEVKKILAEKNVKLIYDEKQ